MAKKRIGLILVLLLALIIFQIIGFLYFNKTIFSLRQEMNSTKIELQSKINENYMLTQGKIDELTSNLIKTEKGLTEQMNELKASASEDFSGVIESSILAVVSIKTDVSQGSGFIINRQGFIVTNAHVLSGAHYAKALTYNQELKDAGLIGYDANLDVALLKIEGNYDFLELDNSNDVRVGEKVIAVGNPLGLSFTVTEGIVSAVDRLGLNNLPYYIQTDVSLNPGNSGGPLINKKGKVIGINNFKVGGSEGLGFALESNQIRLKINEISLQALNQTLI